MIAVLALVALSAAAPAGGHPPRLINEDVLSDAGFSVNALPVADPDGTGVFDLAIAADGKVSACRLADWSGTGTRDAAMERLICDGVRKHARFVGATDASGALVAGPLRIAIDPKLPGEPEILNAAEVFSSDQYPAAALRAAQEGDVHILVDVDSLGTPTRCAVRKSSDVPVLDEATCRLATTRAQFKPAHDSAGRAISAPWKVAVRWQLPDWSSFGDWKARTILAYNAAGTDAQCTLDPAPPPSFQGTFCEEMRAMARAKMSKEIVAGQRVVFEQGFLVGGPDSAKSVGMASGQSRIAMQAVALAIDHDGKVRNCTATDAADAEAIALMCGQQRARRYQPLGNNDADFSDRHAVAYVATYLDVPAP